MGCPQGAEAKGTMTDPSSLTGKTIGRYEIREVIGRGGMATVYKAYHLDLERDAALKVISQHHTSEQFIKRFEREAKTAGQLQHPHILPVFDHGFFEGHPYIVTAYMNGGTLESLMQKDLLPLADMIHYIKQVASALDYAHTKQLVHRDVKPSNVLLDNARNAFLADFGLVKIEEATTDLTGSAIVGTPHYMAPELILQEGPPTPAIDIYSLGVTVFELLTTTHPYSGDTPLQVVMQHVNEPVPDLSTRRQDLSSDVSDVVAKAMAKYPEERYPTAMAFAQALEDVLPYRIPTKVQEDDGRTIPLKTLDDQEKVTADQRSGFQLPVQAIIGVVAVIVVAISLLTSAGALGTLSVAQAEMVDPYITAGGNAISVSGIALSHDGALCAAAGAKNKVIMWDSVTGEKLHELDGLQGTPQAVVFSADGSLVASGSSASEIIVWSSATGETVQTLEGHDDGVMSLVFSPDASQLLSGSMDGTVKIWELETGDIVQTIDAGFAVRSAEFSPDLTTVAVAASDSTVTIWDAASGELVQALDDGHNADLKSVSFSPDGLILASASEDGAIVLWDLVQGVAISEFSPGNDAMNAMQFAPDGQTLIASGPDGQAMEFSAETGAMQRQFDVDGLDIVSMTMSKNGEVVAASTAEGEVFMFRRDI